MMGESIDRKAERIRLEREARQANTLLAKARAVAKAARGK